MGRQTWRIDEDGKHTGGLARSVIEWFGTVQYWYIKEYINTQGQDMSIKLLSVSIKQGIFE